MNKWQNRVLRIATILDPSDHKTSLKVEKRLAQFLTETGKALNKKEDHPFVDNLKRYSKGFWKGLFTCYDHSILPRTNNDLELFFREIKRRHRRITGLRSWNKYIINHGEYIVFTEEANQDPDIISRLTNVSWSDYFQEARKWRNRKAGHIKQFRFKRNPDKYLEAIEKKWTDHQL